MAELTPVLFSLEPDAADPIERTRSWGTDVLPLFSGGEQRIIQRQTPVDRIKFSVGTLTEALSGQLEAALRQARTFRFYVPVWSDATPLTAGVALGATVIPLTDTTNRDFIDGSFAVLWTSPTKCELVTIQSHTGTSLTLVSGTLAAYGQGARAAPCVIARLVSPVPVSRIASAMTRQVLEFEVEGAPSGGATVTPVAARITLTPPGTFAIYIGGSVTTVATVYDAAGNEIPGAPVTWTSSDPTNAPVSGIGLTGNVGKVLGAGLTTGSATITATSGTATVSTTLAVVASFTSQASVPPPPPPAPTGPPNPTPPSPPAHGSGSTPSQSDQFVSSIGANTHGVYLQFNPSKLAVLQAAIVGIGFRIIRDGSSSSAPFFAFLNNLFNNHGVQALLYMDPRFGLALTTPSQITTIFAAVKNALWGVSTCNEPDLGSGPSTTYAGHTYPDWVAAYAHDVKTAVRGSADPVWNTNMRLLSPSLGHSNHFSQFNTGASDLGYTWSGLADMIDMHSYPGGQIETHSLATDIANVRSLSGMGSAAIINTETGYSNDLSGAAGQPGVSDLARAIYLPRRYFENWNLGINATFDYDLYPVAEQGWPLCDPAGSLFTPAITLKNLIAILADPGAPFTVSNLNFLSNPTLGTTIHSTLLQKRNGHWFLALWQPTTIFDLNTNTVIPVPPIGCAVTFEHATITHAQYYRPLYGMTPTALTVTADAVTVPVGSDVVLLEVWP